MEVLAFNPKPFGSQLWVLDHSSLFVEILAHKFHPKDFCSTAVVTSWWLPARAGLAFKAGVMLWDFIGLGWWIDGGEPNIELKDPALPHFPPFTKIKMIFI